MNPIADDRPNVQVPSSGLPGCAARCPRWGGYATLAVALTACLAAVTLPRPVDAAESTVPIDPFAVLADWAASALSAPLEPAVPGNGAQAKGFKPSVVRPPAPDKGGAVPRAFEVRPVILGKPDLPLMGDAARQANTQWSSTLNYQGLYARLLLLEAKSGALTPASLAVPLKPGQRFRIQLLSTFDAAVSVDQLVGQAWTSQHTGQVYPPPGSTVAMKARMPAQLPAAEGDFFVVDGRTPGERLLLRVRPAQAEGGTPSSQPVYRMDQADRSAFLQLVPRGTQPVIEQILQVGR